MRRIVSLILFCMMSALLSAQTYKELATRAIEATQADSLDLAEQLFKKALEAEPANSMNAMLFSNLGTVQRRLGKKDQAIDSYSLALNMAPHSVAILLNRASLYMEKKLTEKAYIDYCNVLDLDRKNEEALLYRAYIYSQRRQYKEARIDYNTLLQKVPEHKMGRFGLALLNQNEGRFREALEELNRLVTDFPDDTSLLKVRANIELEMKTPDLALMDIEAALKIDPNDGETYLMLGDILLSMKKKRDAYSAFEKAIALGIPRPEVQDRLKASK